VGRCLGDGKGIGGGKHDSLEYYWRKCLGRV
jgi:hypothetical protein